ncbi:MAG: outer membrane protein assembly factor BamA [Chthoniobacterales bacterium]|nr:outer membrane protein assembly factor BamA [Chthoniobacterales bacterium]
MVNGDLFGQYPAGGVIVRDLQIRFVGPETISRERVLANLATKVGQPFNQLTVEQDLRALHGTGLIENARIFAEPVEDGARVVVEIKGRPLVTEVRVEGASAIPEKRVRKEITLKVGEPFDSEKAAEDRNKILKLYQDRNYPDVQVDIERIEDSAKKQLIVVFRIKEGGRMIVRKISFAGNTNIRASELRKAMQTKVRNVLYVFNKSGRLMPQQMEEDKAAIVALYQSRGFADAEVVNYEIRPTGSKNGVEILITIYEGPKYKVSKISFTGVTVVDLQVLDRLLKMREGDLYTPQGLNGDIKAIRDFYGTQGYADVVIVPDIFPSGETQVEINYQIEEGVQSYVNLVNIQGNVRTKDRVIRREIAVRPGDLFDTTRVDLSKQRLVNLNYFSKVELVPQDTLIPGRKDLNVIVEEKRTGSFNIGAGFSTIDSLVGFAELQQTNFDLFGWPRFTGGGQRFRLRGQYGIKRNDFVISFIEPWFLEQKLSLGVEGFYHEATYLSTVYDQRNYGGAVQLRRPLLPMLTGQLEYRGEGIEIYDVDKKKVGPQILDSVGTYMRSSLSATLTWDSRDNLFLTRRGEQIEFTAYVAGGFLGGDVQDYGLNLEASKYFKLPLDCIFLLKGQVAVVDNWGSSEDVPIFDRLYLGGANSMRGFDFREVGPKDKFGNPIGGNSLAYATAEITFPIISRVRGATFLDVGFVNSSSWDWDPSGYNADFGFGIRVDLPIGPVRVDYGIPIKSDDWNGSSGKFNFNIGYQF